ncbi:hypothetical protein [Gilliamella intestini]|uniref:Uncharacterized protein n=1 Tax=Gilliamella intestini TaxID=1798183 RepID=A0A1C4D740_9GAMM|nr:hypothetical protein [Gilliamella intestini]SCC27162.1 hypothetical protein GA0061080_10616 [Gilliamella intestini]
MKFTLADKLPESEKTIILVEKEARLIQASKPDGTLPAGLGIQFIGDANHYYVKVKPEYTLKLSSNLSVDATKMAINGINGTVENKKGEVNKHRLTQTDKTDLINRYQANYPELTLADIPDEVELVSGVSSSNDNNDTELTICFVVENKLATRKRTAHQTLVMVEKSCRSPIKANSKHQTNGCEYHYP